MKQFCELLLSMAIFSGLTAVLLLIFRSLLIRLGAQRKLIVLLWILLAIRMSTPFSVSAHFSPVPVIWPQQSIAVEKTEVNATEPIIPDFGSGAIVDNRSKPQATTCSSVFFGVFCVYIVGLTVMLLYLLISSLILNKKLSGAIPFGTMDNVFVSDCVGNAFVWGIVHPKVILPGFLSEQHRGLVVRHEKAHISRKDYIWKMLGFLLLSLYWYHPLIWIAFLVFQKDIEYACDEKTVSRFSKEEKRIYMDAMMKCSVKDIGFHGQIAFGSANVKQRIRALTSTRKRSVTMIVLLSVLVCILSACLYTQNDNGKASDYRFGAGVIRLPEGFALAEKDDVIYDPTVFDAQLFKSEGRFVKEGKTICISRSLSEIEDDSDHPATAEAYASIVWTKLFLSYPGKNQELRHFSDIKQKGDFYCFSFRHFPHSVTAFFKEGDPAQLQVYIAMFVYEERQYLISYETPLEDANSFTELIESVQLK